MLISEGVRSLDNTMGFIVTTDLKGLTHTDYIKVVVAIITTFSFHSLIALNAKYSNNLNMENIITGMTESLVLGLFVDNKEKPN